MMKLNTYELFLAKLFKKHSAYFIGDELNKKLQKEFDVSDTASRKIIQRACEKGVITSSSPLTFGKGTYAYFPPGVSISIPVFLEITKKRRPPLFRVLNQILFNNGILSYYEALKIAGAPLKLSKSKSNQLDDLILELESTGFVKTLKDSLDIKYLVLKDVFKSGETDNLIKNHQTKMKVDSMFLNDIINSFKKSNLIDNHNVVYRNRKVPSKGAVHNNFVWDCFCYTKTSGINTVYGKNSGIDNKQALVVMDVVIAGAYSINDLDGFIARINVLINNTSTHRKILPIIVFSEIPGEVLNRAHAFGILTYNIGTIYGEKVFEILEGLYKIKLSEVAKNLVETENPFEDSIDIINSTIESISKTGQGANLQNITGDLFESLMFQLLKEIYPSAIIEQGRQLPNYEKDPETKSFEYDFIVTSHQDSERVIVEVKGFKSSNTIKLGDYKSKNTIKWFFNRTYCSAKAFYSDDKSFPFPTKACYITTASFDDEAAKHMGKLISEQPSKLSLFYDHVSLLSLLEENPTRKKIKKILEKYYIN